MPINQSMPQNPLRNPPGQSRLSGAENNLPFGLDKRALLIIGVIFTIVVLGVLLAVGELNKKKQGQQQPSGTSLEVSKPVPGASPPSLPQVQDKSKADKLRDYFAKASVNFKEQFMAKVADVAADKYLEYSQAADPEKKLEAARAFYIYLNNPAVDKSDPGFTQFLADVKADLEKALGKALF